MPERFGDANGSSGWTWGKGGIGMGGKDSGEQNHKNIFSQILA
jgi:hypothetical protein